MTCHCDPARRKPFALDTFVQDKKLHILGKHTSAFHECILHTDRLLPVYIEGTCSDTLCPKSFWRIHEPLHYSNKTTCTCQAACSTFVSKHNPFSLFHCVHVSAKSSHVTLFPGRLDDTIRSGMPSSLAISKTTSA